MRVVQAMYWLQDVLSRKEERERVLQRLSKIVVAKEEGEAIREDLQKGLSSLPIWMQPLISVLVSKNQREDRSKESERE